MIKLININGKPYILNIHKPTSKKTVIFSHGFLSNKNKPFTKSSAYSLARAGIKAVRFNYGVEQVSKRVEILREVINKFKDSESIGLVGNSLGGMIALLLANHPKVKSLVLINPVYDPWNAYENYIKIRQILSKLMIGLVKEEFLEQDLKSIVKKLTKPVMVISSSNDRIIPQRLMKQLYSDLKGEKKIVNLRGSGHSIWNPVHVERVREEIREWFKNTL